MVFSFLTGAAIMTEVGGTIGSGLAAPSDARNSMLNCSAVFFLPLAANTGQTRSAAPRSCFTMSITVGAQRFGVSRK